jgi:hypothetical protein
MRIDNHPRALNRRAPGSGVRLNDLLIRNVMLQEATGRCPWVKCISELRNGQHLWLPSAVSMYATLRIGTSCWPVFFRITRNKYVRIR